MGVVQNKIDIAKLEKILSNGISDGKMIYKPLNFDVLGYNIKIEFTNTSVINTNGIPVFLAVINPENFEILEMTEITNEELATYNYVAYRFTTYQQLTKWQLLYNSSREDGLIELLVTRADVDNSINNIQFQNVKIICDNTNLDYWGFFKIEHTFLEINDLGIQTTNITLNGYETSQGSVTITLVT